MGAETLILQPSAGCAGAGPGDKPPAATEELLDHLIALDEEDMRDRHGAGPERPSSAPAGRHSAAGGDEAAQAREDTRSELQDYLDRLRQSEVCRARGPSTR